MRSPTGSIPDRFLKGGDDGRAVEDDGAGGLPRSLPAEGPVPLPPAPHTSQLGQAGGVGPCQGCRIQSLVTLIAFA